MPEPEPGSEFGFGSGSGQTIAATAQALRHAHPITAGAGWDFGGFKVWVQSNDAALIEVLERYFAGFRCLPAPPAPDATLITALQHGATLDLGRGHEMTPGPYKASVNGPKEAYVDLVDGRLAHKLRTGMWFLFGGDLHLAVGPCRDNPNQVINFINNRMIQRTLHRGALLGHASAVVHQAGRDPEAPRAAVAIAGFSGMGKSTLALHLLNDRRLDFLSNDRVMLEAPTRDSGDDSGDGPGIWGVPKHPRINPGTILHNPALAPLLDPDQRAQFEALDPAQLWALEHKFDGLISTCFPAQRFLLRARLCGLVILDWTRGGGPCRAQRVDLRTRTQLLPALMKAPGSFYQPGPRELPSRDATRYLEFLDGVPVVELSGGVDFDRGRSAALALLDL